MLLNGAAVNEDIYTGWINYLFHESFCEKNRNPWKLFEMLSSGMAAAAKGYDSGDTDWYGFLSTTAGLVGYTEILAVQEGIDAMLQWHDDLQKEAGISQEDGERKLTFFDAAQLHLTK
ncbi:MAG: hypothetical protein LUI14_02695 [Lachnospiraceae bacterium]|nr:hypothetical protein [Lachnospiraceae bacterium]